PSRSLLLILTSPLLRGSNALYSAAPPWRFGPPFGGWERPRGGRSAWCVAASLARRRPAVRPLRAGGRAGAAALGRASHDPAAPGRPSVRPARRCAPARPAGSEAEAARPLV